MGSLFLVGIRPDMARGMHYPRTNKEPSLLGDAGGEGFCANCLSRQAVAGRVANMAKLYRPDAVASLVDPHETPAGLVVPGRAFDALVKAKAREIAAQEGTRPESRLFSRYGWNMIMHGAREKPQGTPNFAMLYDAAERSFVDAILIKARVNQMKAIWQRAWTEKKVGFSVVHDRYDDPDFNSNTETIKARCREVEDLLLDPTPVKHLHLYPHNVRVHDGLKNLISYLIRAELVIDRKAIQRYKRADGKGYAAFHWLPGESIKNVDESLRAWAKRNEPAGTVTRWTAEKMSYATGFDLTRAAYTQMIDGELVAAFAPDEIAVHVANPSDRINRWGYGSSVLEQSLEITAMLLYAFTYNKDMFKTNYPEGLLTVSGDYDEEGLRRFKEQVLQEGGGPGANWRLPVIPAPGRDNVDAFKVEFHKLRDTPKDMLFDQLVRFMILFKCAAFGTPPATIGFNADSGGGQTLFAPGTREVDVDLAKDHGLRTSLTDMCEWLTNEIVKPRYDDLKIVIHGLDKEDEKAAVEIRGNRASKWLTRNEARQEENRAPIGDKDDPTNPWNLPADQPLAMQISTFQMVAQQSASQYGEEPEGGFDDAGFEDVDEEDSAPEGRQTGPWGDDAGVKKQEPPAQPEGLEKAQKRYLTIRLLDD